MADDKPLPKNFVLQESNLVMHSCQSGLTGMAVASPGSIIVATNGQSDRRFSQDVDNYLNVGDVKNIIVGALVDNLGQIRGVLQLVNKEDSEGGKITEEDKKDI